MKKAYTILFILGAISLLIHLESCGKMIVDTEPVNNPSDDFSDAGSFEDDRDKFLGFYIGSNVCNLPGHWDGERFAFYIKDDPDDITKVRVEFPNQNHPYQIGWIATAEGNTLLFDDSIEEQKNDCEPGSAKEFTLSLKGTATFDGKTFLFPDFTYTIKDSIGEVSCRVTCNIKADKVK